MKTLAFRLAVGLATFVVGISLTLFALKLTAPRAALHEVETAVVELPKPGCGKGAKVADSKAAETPEEKAVRLAEEFVARNGYTDLPADRENLSYESIEWSSNVDEMLRSRHDSLERKAYGVVDAGRMGGPGWTVVFKYRRGYGHASDRMGRAVTMDGDFMNLRVEHKDFFLAGVEKKL